MGSRLLYYAAKISEMPKIGITKFERIMSEKGMTLKQKRKWVRTTFSVKHQYENLINGMELIDINTVVTGDITYYSTENQRYYIFTLKDQYSKRILGLYGSTNMYAQCALETFYQLLKVRKKENLQGMIHHTDAGSQYLSKAYKAELEKYGTRISIAKNCLENGSAEQLNGVVKNDYLINYEIRNVKHLNKILQKIKKLINEEKPVALLGYRTPIEFEKYIKGLSNKDRPKVVLFDFEAANETEGRFSKA